MEKLLFIAHAFHQKTRSHAFLEDVLKRKFDIVFGFVSPDEPDIAQTINLFLGVQFDAIVCWQIFPPPDLLLSLSNQRTVLFPMYDQSGRWGLEEWFPYRSFRIVSFSRTLFRRLHAWGFDVRYFQYFPEPESFEDYGDPEAAFFWHRTTKISLDTICKVLNRSQVQRVHVHKVLDPGQAAIRPREGHEGRFRIGESTWFESPEDMRRTMRSCGVYMAPRLFEGIGMSFLEAMAMGRCVVAPDRPTMNEYIEHGRTGFLYDPKRPKPIELGDIRPIQQRAHSFIVEGYKNWLIERERIPHLFDEPLHNRPCILWWRQILNMGIHPFRITRKWRRRWFAIRIRRNEWKVRFLGFQWKRERH